LTGGVALVEATAALGSAGEVVDGAAPGASPEVRLQAAASRAMMRTKLFFMAWLSERGDRARAST
jgi:hypothetical protein